MSFSRLAGIAGMGFVVILIVANLLLTMAGFPTPSEAASLDEITTVFAAGSGSLRLASALLPISRPGHRPRAVTGQVVGADLIAPTSHSGLSDS